MAISAPRKTPSSLPKARPLDKDKVDKNKGTVFTVPLFYFSALDQFEKQIIGVAHNGYPS